MAADRQIAQLLLQVDANIAVAQRSLQELARTVNQTSGQMNTALGSTSAAHAKLNGAFNQTRLAQMELSHVMTASVDAYAAGASPLRILTLEMGRVAQAASFMGGGTGVMGKLGAFMSGPWGIAVLLATAVLGQLIGKMGQGTTSVADLVEKMREHAKEAEKSKLADDQWANSIDGLIERNDKLVESLNKRFTAEGDIELQEEQAAERGKRRADQDLKDAQTKLNNLEAQQRSQSGGPSGVGIGQGAAVSGVSGANLANQIAQAKSDLADAQREVASANAALSKQTIALGQEEGKAFSDLGAAVELWAKRYASALTGIENANKGALADSAKPISAAFESLKKAMGDAAGEGLNKTFLDARTRAKELGNELAKTGNVAKYTDEMNKLAASTEAAAKAAQDAKRHHADGDQIFDGQISSYYATANRYRGTQETGSGRNDLEALFSQANIHVDPKMTAWCAAFVNAVLATNGVKGTGSLAASSFLTYGRDDIHSPQQGDIAVLRRKDGGDHVGFVESYDKKTGSVRVLGGNTGDKVASATYSKNDVLAIRRPPTPSEAAQDSAKSAKQGLLADDTFARESAQLDAEILAARQQLLGGFDSQADFATQQVEADKKALLASIQKQQDAGTIGKNEADALRVQADDLAAAREAVIARRKYTDNLQSLAEQQKQETDFQISDLKFADEMAKTQGEHRRLQLQILDIQYKQKEADLERLLATIQSNKDFATSVDLQRQAMEIQGQLAHLPIERAQDQTRVQQGTLDPLQKYFNDLPHTADQINQALGSIEADGIQGLVNALSHAGEGWGAMRDLAISALQDIAQKLIQLGIEKLLFNTLGSVLGGGAGIGGGASILSSGGSALSTGFVGLDGLGFADGGFVSGSGTPTSDSIPAMLSNGEYVLNADAVKKFGVGFLDHLNEGRVPHKKGGGLLGALSFLSPLAFLASHGGGGGGFLKYLSPALFLGEELFGKHGDKGNKLNPLELLSPAAFLASKAFPQQSKISIPKAANSNNAAGDTYNIHVVAPNTGDPLKDRQTGMQFAAGIEAGMSSRRRKGLAG